MRIVVTPQKAVQAGDFTLANRYGIPHERCVCLTFEIMARWRLDLSPRWSCQVGHLAEPAVKPMVVPELNCKRQPGRITLGHYHMQIGIALKDAAEGQPAQRLTQAHTLVVPEDVGLARGDAALESRIRPGSHVHRDRHLQAVTYLPDRLPLVVEVGPFRDRVGQ